MANEVLRAIPLFDRSEFMRFFGEPLSEEVFAFIGKIEKGFDFLDYHFGPEGLSVAAKTVERFVERAIRLYEQEPGEACASSRFGV